MSRGVGNAPRDPGKVVEYLGAEARMAIFDTWPREVRDAFNNLVSCFSVKQVDDALGAYDTATVLRMLDVKDKQRTKQRYDARGYHGMEQFLWKEE